MKIICNLVMKYDTKSIAEKIARVIKVDDQRYIKTDVYENNIIATSTASNVMSMIHTLEDYLSCVSVAEKLITKR